MNPNTNAPGQLPAKPQSGIPDDVMNELPMTNSSLSDVTAAKPLDPAHPTTQPEPTVINPTNGNDNTNPMPIDPPNTTPANPYMNMAPPPPPPAPIPDASSGPGPVPKPEPLWPIPDSQPAPAGGGLNDMPVEGPAPLAPTPAAAPAMPDPAPVPAPSPAPAAPLLPADPAPVSPPPVQEVAIPIHDSSPTSTPAPLPASATPASKDELIEIKKGALQELNPLVGHISQEPAERFKTLLDMIRASDDTSLVKPAYEAANAIQNEEQRAKALLEIVKEVNYLTQDSPGSPPPTAP